MKKLTHITSHQFVQLLDRNDSEDKTLVYIQVVEVSRDDDHGTADFKLIFKHTEIYSSTGDTHEVYYGIRFTRYDSQLCEVGIGDDLKDPGSVIYQDREDDYYVPPFNIPCFSVYPKQRYLIDYVEGTGLYCDKCEVPFNSLHYEGPCPRCKKSCTNKPGMKMPHTEGLE